MTGRERLLTMLENGKPDRFSGQVHNWMQYYLDTYMNGMSAEEAYGYFGLDWVIYVGWGYGTNLLSFPQWKSREIPVASSSGGETRMRIEVETPGGTLRYHEQRNAFTSWLTDYPVHDEKDFDIFEKYFPVPDVDPHPVIVARERTGDKGIVRGYVWCFGQPGPWQDFTCLVGTQRAIEFAIDKPDWVHHCLDVLTKKKIAHIYKMDGVPYDLIENGGGSASTTVISPKMFREFCLPYDTRIHTALHDKGFKVTYHVCGGLMPILEDIVENRCDAMETFTPPGMGGDARLEEAFKRIGDRVCFIGGFDQQQGFERGTPAHAREMVYEAFAAAGKKGGFILSPSDHFFFGDPANIKAFADAIKDCVY